MIKIMLSLFVFVAGNGTEVIGEVIDEPIPIEALREVFLEPGVLVSDLDEQLVAESIERQRAIKEEVTVKKQSEAEVNVTDHNFEALVKATWALETGWGKSSLWLNSYNPGGVKCGSQYCVYESEEHGMQSLRNLLKKYVDRFGYDFEAIRSVYSETDDTALFRSIYYKVLEN